MPLDTNEETIRKIVDLVARRHQIDGRGQDAAMRREDLLESIALVLLRAGHGLTADVT